MVANFYTLLFFSRAAFSIDFFLGSVHSANNPGFLQLNFVLLQPSGIKCGTERNAAN